MSLPLLWQEPLPVFPAPDLVALWRRCPGSPAAPVLLHLGPRTLNLVWGAALEEGLALPLGYAELASLFPHRPPRPEEWEAAIMAVEDQLAPARPRVPSAGRLWCADPLITALTALVAGDAAPALAREALEQCFQRLCQARPGGSAGLPEGPEFAALVLVLRELLHHYGYAGVELVEGDGGAEA
ncbi:hypothetical protein [Azospira inquinata]|uniref:Uncharacterized protein n=1 Tax=Azospira inquinata TaxID=2785627 RepID=A0A975XVW5_9RHOO|nr:hypothetical protein [Azospira inquinata]QWT47117.1 hypothetical protein J8L76_05250 [Azospira inquinata]QWT50254.1 hypothetical protein Azoinq_06620 [Azospira inquinata]